MGITLQGKGLQGFLFRQAISDFTPVEEERIASLFPVGDWSPGSPIGFSETNVSAPHMAPTGAVVGGAGPCALAVVKVPASRGL